MNQKTLLAAATPTATLFTLHSYALLSFPASLAAPGNAGYPAV